MPSSARRVPIERHVYGRLTGVDPSQYEVFLELKGECCSTRADLSPNVIDQATTRVAQYGIGAK